MIIHCSVIKKIERKSVFLRKKDINKWNDYNHSREYFTLNFQNVALRKTPGTKAWHITGNTESEM